MFEFEWVSCTDPVRMVDWVTALHPRSNNSNLSAWISGRKMRLFALACMSSRPGLQDLAELAKAAEAADGLEGYGWASVDVISMVRLILNHEEPGVSAAADAALLREIIGDPFRQRLRWVVCPECVPKTKKGRVRMRAVCGTCDRSGTVPSPWFTPTVLELGNAIYNKRDWEGLPSLADALEEAGCPPDEKRTEAVGVTVWGDPDGWHCGHYTPGGPTKPIYTSNRRSKVLAWAKDTYRCKDFRSWRRNQNMSAVGKLTRVVPSPLLGHLRSLGQHHLGCWALDHVIGKT